MFAHYKWLFALSCLLALSLLIAAGTGAYPMAPWDIPRILWNQEPGFEILVHIRLPRVILASLIGAILALAGASLQGLFRNPLADPGLIGVSAGAALGAAFWIVLGGSTFLGMWGTPTAAFSSSLLLTIALWKLAQIEGRVVTLTLLLAGIAMNSFAGAGIGLMTYLADEQELQTLTFWMLGSLGGATWSLVGVTLPFLLLALLILFRLAPALNAMSLGESEAYHVGVSVNRVKQWTVLGSALGVGAAVSASGAIGFVGLVIPHLMRMAISADQRFVLPGGALAGASLLVWADLLSRVVVSPAEFPVGIVTALIGGPFFLGLLLRYKRTLL